MRWTPLTLGGLRLSDLAPLFDEILGLEPRLIILDSNPLFSRNRDDAVQAARRPLSHLAFAKVEEVSVTDGEVIGFNEFQITS